MSKISDATLRASEVKNYYYYSYIDSIYSILYQQRLNVITKDDVNIELKRLPNTNEIVQRLNKHK